MEKYLNSTTAVWQNYTMNKTWSGATLIPTDTNTTDVVPGCRDADTFFFYEDVQQTLMWIMFVIIIIGNSIVLIAIRLVKANRRSRMNFFILHLATADLLVGLVSVLTDAIRKTTINWYAGPVMCKIVLYLVDVVTYASTFLLVSLSIDRFDAIARPLNFSGKALRARLLVGTAWTLAFLFSIPMLVIANQVDIANHGPQCWINLPGPWHWQVYFTLVSCVVFILPTLIISACYTAIIYIIWSKSKILAPVKKPSVHQFKRKPNTEEDALGKENSRNLNGKRSEGRTSQTSSRGIIPQAKIRTIKMTLIIIIAFVMCWSPFFIFNLLDVYGHLPCTKHKIAVSTLIQSLAPLNSAANPVIYGIFSTRVCRYLRKFPVINWVAVRLCGCCIEKVDLRRKPSNIGTTHTDFTSTGMSDTETGLGRTSFRSRRHSGMPVIRDSSSEKDNEILLHSLKPQQETAN